MPSCIEQKTKKYRSRGSPPYSAMDCKGCVKPGNDGAIYESKSDKRGIYRWVKNSAPINPINSKISKNKTVKASSVKESKCLYKKTDYGAINVSKFILCITDNTLKQQLEKPLHIYEINDNATFTFVVFDYGRHVTVYNNHFNEATNRGELKDKLMDVKYEQIFVGDNESNDPYWIFKRGVAKGNTLLLQTGKGKYLFIGKGILSFSTKDGDTIRNFYSPIGGNYDSFTCAIGDKYVYLLNDKKYAPIGEFDINKDVIKQYYCYEKSGECKKYKTMTLPMKKVYAPFYRYY